MPSQEFLNRKGSVWERINFFEMDFKEARTQMDAMILSELQIPEGIRIEEDTVGSIPGRWIRTDAPQEKLIYYVHGGGFTHGSSIIPLPFLCQMAARHGYNSFSVDYRLAPEHPYPAGVDDATAAYRGLLDLGYKPENIVLCGESAGAVLCFSLIYRFRCEGLPQPAAIVPMSPLADMLPEGIVSSQVIPGLHKAPANDLYAPGQDLSNPEISPIFGDMTGFPPSFLSAGGAEALCPHCLRLAQKLAESGCEVKMLIGKDMIHTYPLDCLDYPEAMAAFEEIALFIKQL